MFLCSHTVKHLIHYQIIRINLVVNLLSYQTSKKPDNSEKLSLRSHSVKSVS